MERKSLIVEFFEKKGGITRKDLEDFLKDANESVILEFKEITERKNAKGLILKSLIGFLNSIEGQGLLIVGVSDDKQIRGVSPEYVNRQKIVNWIRDSISAIPPAVIPPYLDFVEIEAGEGKYVYLIEVKREDDVVYFSRESGCAYVRIGDSTKRLNLDEALELVAKKSFARPCIIFEVEKVRETSEDVVLMLHPKIRNVGAKPAFYVVALIDIMQNPAVIETRVHSRNQLKKLSDYLFQLNAAFLPLSPPSYPGVDSTFNDKIELKIKKGFNQIGLTCTCFEREVMSTAAYFLYEKDILSKDEFELLPYKPIFRPYVTLRHYAP